MFWKVSKSFIQNHKFYIHITISKNIRLSIHAYNCGLKLIPKGFHVIPVNTTETHCIAEYIVLWDSILGFMFESKFLPSTADKFSPWEATSWQLLVFSGNWGLHNRILCFMQHKLCIMSCAFCLIHVAIKSEVHNHTASLSDNGIYVTGLQRFKKLKSVMSQWS